MTHYRKTPIEMDRDEFREAGYRLINTIAGFIGTIHKRKVTTGESPSEIRDILGDGSLPESGTPVPDIVDRTSDLMLNHSLFNGHPKFLGYVTSSPAPVGALADLLAASVNANVGANILSPVATAIEKQTIRWLAEFIGYPAGAGGILVSGGNMANFTAFLAARTAKAPANLKEDGLPNFPGEMVMYCSKATHTWMEKAAVLFGHGLRSIRWIPVDAKNRMNIKALEKSIHEDLKHGKKPFLVTGNAGDVSTGAVDNFTSMASVCKEYDLWFHIDGAYGIPAAALPELRQLFKGIGEADSIAMDPHKWLYAPLEVGCTLVKDPQHLLHTYSSHPVYYNFGAMDEEPALNFYEYGLQNSRGFRGLKVWMAMQQVGRKGYMEMIREDIAISEHFFQMAKKHPELEALSQNLSITTLRYVPQNLALENDVREIYLNTLNEELLNTLQKGGEVFLSNAVISEKYCLRACIVNFRTSERDMEEIIGIIAREGRRIHERFQKEKVV